VCGQEPFKVDIGEYKIARFRTADERWLGLEVTIYAHSTLNGVGSREIRVLVEYGGTISDKKRVADAVVSGVQRPGAPKFDTSTSFLGVNWRRGLVHQGLGGFGVRKCVV